MIGFYDYTVFLTYLNLLFGGIGIYSAIEGNISKSLFCLVLAGICDAFDGSVANRKPQRSWSEILYGIQIDSLADMVSFCLLPATIILTTTEMTSFHLLAALFFILSGLIRLAYFNVTEIQRKLDKKTVPRTHFLGLPVTSVAFLLPIYWGISQLYSLSFSPKIFFFFIGIAFISPIKIPKMVNHKKVRSKKHEKKIAR